MNRNPISSQLPTHRFLNNDNQLIQECLKGTQSAFKALYNNYQGYCYTICIRYGVSTSEVKDCMQVIFMEIFKSLKNYNPKKAQFKTWLTRITINQILMHKRKARIIYDTYSDEKVNVVDRSFTIPIDEKLDEEIMHDLLSKMPEKYITVFNLFIIDGYSHQEIAKAINITENTSRVLLHRARHWAMNQLKPLFNDTVSSFKKSS